MKTRFIEVRKMPLSFHIDIELKEVLHEAADAHECSMSAYITQILRRHVQRLQQKRQKSEKAGLKKVKKSAPSPVQKVRKVQKVN
jgi:predicted transcriptional regulator